MATDHSRQKLKGPWKIMRRIVAALLVWLLLATSAFAAAPNATAVWRHYTGGTDNNGGGFDTAIGTPTATGSNASSAGGSNATIADPTTNAFSGVSANQAINIPGVGQWLITAVTDANHIVVSGYVPPLPAGTSWTIGQGTDYSQQTSAQVSQSSTANTSTSTTALTDTGAAFTSALIGNAIKVSGTGITTTYTFITAVGSATALTLQASPGTTGTSVSYNIGGAWQTTANDPSWITNGNLDYYKGAGIPSPASYSNEYTVSAGNWHPSGGSSGPGTEMVTLQTDPTTPSYDGTKTGGLAQFNVTNGTGITGAIGTRIINIWAVAGVDSSAGVISNTAGNNYNIQLFGSVIDTFGYDTYGFNSLLASQSSTVVGNEIYSSHAARGGTTRYCLAISGVVAAFNYVHNCTGAGGIYVTDGGSLFGNVSAANHNDGIFLDGQDAVINNTSADNTRDGIRDHADINTTGVVASNISASNGGVGLNLTLHNSAVNARSVLQSAVDYNSFYNNTGGNYTNIPPGPHDTILSSTPFASGTQNYTLK